MILINLKNKKKVLRTDDEGAGHLASSPSEVGMGASISPAAAASAAIDNYASSPDPSFNNNNNNHTAGGGGRSSGANNNNNNNSSSFLANECLSYAFSVWRMEGAWSSSQTAITDDC